MLRPLFFLVLCLLHVQGLAKKSPYLEMNVFSLGEAGYYCIKIPTLLQTKSGALIAMGEARYNSCSDYTGTDLVYKRSFDNGQTWSKLAILYGNTSIERNISTVIGNAAPVQLKTGRIIVPFCRNNLEVFQLHSDNDGANWTAPVKVENVVQNGWNWIGTGPPGSIQLQSGRIVTPSYHSALPHSFDGADAHSHLLLNDDPNGSPSSWRIGAIAPGPISTSECQAVELEPDHILIASRSPLLMKRSQIESFDGGETLGTPYYISITEPFGGCEGSIVNHRKYKKLFFSQTVNWNPERYNMTVFTSSDEGKNWSKLIDVNTGKTAYSSLQILQDGDTVGLLYERSNSSDFIFLPTEISFVKVWPDPIPANSTVLQLNLQNEGTVQNLNNYAGLTIIDYQQSAVIDNAAGIVFPCNTLAKCPDFASALSAVTQNNDLCGCYYLSYSLNTGGWGRPFPASYSHTNTNPPSGWVIPAQGSMTVYSNATTLLALQMQFR